MVLMGLVIALDLNETVQVGEMKIRCHSFNGSRGVKLHFDGPKEIKISRLGDLGDWQGIKKVQDKRVGGIKKIIEIKKSHASD